MSDINSMGVAFYVAAFLISLTCIIYTFIQHYTDKLQKKFYLIMLIIIVLNTITELLVEIINPHKSESIAFPYVLEYCKYFYFIFHTALLPILGYYVLCITGRFRRFTRIKHILFILPVSLVELLMITNPIHHWCFHYDTVNIDYHRGFGVTLLYAVSAFYILFFIVNIFSAWKAITKKRRIALGYFLTMVIIGIFIQMIFFNARVELFAESLAYLGLLLTVEDEGDLIDTDAGIYNRKALKIDVDNLLANKQAFYVICIKIENSDIVRRVTGSSNADIMSSMMFKELTKYISRYYIYQTAPDTFVLTLINETNQKAMLFAQKICDRFEKSWDCQHASVMLSATVMMAQIPTDINNTEEVFDMIDGTLPRDHKKLLVGKNDLGYLLRRKAVESAMQRGLMQGGFEVYYQPTFSVDELKVHGAEALIRLHDEKLGNLFPDEFIPIAEQIGLIGEIDDYVLSCVCRFISGGIPEKLGINSINVNLSVIQCAKPGFVEHIIDMVNRSGVDRSRVNFEITESVDVSDYQVMRNVIHQFRQNGFNIYMDDYGTGYSNVHALFSMDFNIIKIDKSILWGAEKSELGMIILENNIRMLRQMKLGILVEGVETEAQVELLKKLEVDYLQGFYFSRPVPEKDLIELLEKNN